ncbi:methylated-DNA--[protein]-cysteine S-methyltransferase [Alphaproteobacteria bacterium GH1-50]|uniref:methylated-DNA--[protein]-cysteine S-methyltransferase n=1 Tax=Kangsaoukella pontilimi TaxID=2691042 RepID=A0A7C9MFX1_9RHOB|nr:trifunctional transcriptional activator/DNA repair protein Ada/methylated-DNA--[protein]-cysteine S-methyltransferase [Kangsaoukella pontilimi]MXQ09851.1 methylated-DNA--[protein]-cysteine S-methyltransferase [Kangsaoukella pontilimi]
MLFDLPDHDTLYQALLDRDDRYEGHAFVCVSTTGIFCRLTCPARKPNSENCRFVATIGECIEAGFRPCKRCTPLQAAASADPTIASLLALLDERPEYRWSERDLDRMGYDLSTVRRSFKRQFGMTFLEMARQRRLRDGFEVLEQGGRVIDAQVGAGFDSPSAFREAFARLLGRSPRDLRSGGDLQASWIGTPIGDMIAVSSRSHLHLLEFVDRKALPSELARLTGSGKLTLGIGRTGPTEQAEAELSAFFSGESSAFETPLAPPGSAFSKSVWDELCRIPAGETRSYSDIARAIGQPTATRAVARANGANQIALMIPCHRVIGADGSLTGYGGGLWRKQRLLEIERQYRGISVEAARTV